MRFRKVKYNGSQVELISISTQEDGTVTESITRSRQRPLKPFNDALQAFAPLVGKCLDFTAKYTGDLLVTGISLNTVEKTNLRGLVISFRKDVTGARAPFFGNTPHLAESGDGEAGPGLLGANWMATIAELEKCAAGYVRGEREQGELPLDGSKEPEEAELETAGVND